MSYHSVTPGHRASHSSHPASSAHAGNTNTSDQSTADGHNITTLLDNIKTLVMVTLNTCVSEYSEQPAALSAQTGERLQPLDCSYSRVPSSLAVSVSPGAAATGLRLGTEISKPVHECKLSSIICKYCMIKMT